MRMTGLMVAILVVSGAGAFASGIPETVRLTDSVLTVVLSDGTICRAPVGAGQMGGCGAGYAYNVVPEAHPNILRRAVEAIAPEGVLYPMARIVLTDMSGRRYEFSSPPPMPESDHDND